MAMSGVWTRVPRFTGALPSRGVPALATLFSPWGRGPLPLPLPQQQQRDVHSQRQLKKRFWFNNANLAKANKARKAQGLEPNLTLPLMRPIEQKSKHHMRVTDTTELT